MRRTHFQKIQTNLLIKQEKEKNKEKKKKKKKKKQTKQKKSNTQKNETNRKSAQMTNFIHTTPATNPGSAGLPVLRQSPLSLLVQEVIVNLTVTFMRYFASQQALQEWPRPRLGALLHRGQNVFQLILPFVWGSHKPSQMFLQLRHGIQGLPSPVGWDRGQDGGGGQGGGRAITAHTRRPPRGAAPASGRAHRLV